MRKQKSSISLKSTFYEITHKNLGVLRGDFGVIFLRCVCPNDAQMAKTMIPILCVYTYLSMHIPIFLLYINAVISSFTPVVMDLL